MWAGLWGLGILLLTSLPREAFASLPTFGVTDLVVHALMYMPLAVLVFRALELSNPRMAIAGLVVYAAAICVAFAAFDELHQYPIPGRFADVRDWLADCVGIGVGLAVGAATAGYRRRRRERELLPDGESGRRKPDVGAMTKGERR
mgnify:CR=1 FL=1